VVEWLKAPGCKPGPLTRYVGSNPTLPTKSAAARPFPEGRSLHFLPPRLPKRRPPTPAGRVSGGEIPPAERAGSTAGTCGFAGPRWSVRIGTGGLEAMLRHSTRATARRWLRSWRAGSGGRPRRGYEPSPGRLRGGERVRALHNGNALAFQARVAGSIPAARSNEKACIHGLFSFSGRRL
jgi:hypothetical protein